MHLVINSVNNLGVPYFVCIEKPNSSKTRIHLQQWEIQTVPETPQRVSAAPGPTGTVSVFHELINALDIGCERDYHMALLL